MAVLEGFLAAALRRAAPSAVLPAENASQPRVRDAIILGVLLEEVAKAHEGLSAEEEAAVLKVLERRASLEEAGLALAAAREAAEHRPDLQGFTREVNKLPYEERVRVVEWLFDVALADRDLHFLEVEAVRKIAGLLWVTHKDMIEAKLRAKAAAARPAP